MTLVDGRPTPYKGNSLVYSDIIFITTDVSTSTVLTKEKESDMCPMYLSYYTYIHCILVGKVVARGGLIIFVRMN